MHFFCLSTNTAYRYADPDELSNNFLNNANVSALYMFYKLANANANSNAPNQI